MIVLSVHDVISLQLVSRRFFEIARDANLWKQYCFQHSHFKFWEIHQGIVSRAPLPIPEPRVLELQRIVARSITGTARPDSDIRDEGTSQEIPTTGTRRRPSLANWHPSYQSENVDWYEEYIARHAPLSIGWLQQPAINIRNSRERLEIRGLGLTNNGDNNVVVAPLDDGSVCVWDIGQNNNVNDGQSGQILGRSKPGILTVTASGEGLGNPSTSSKAKATNPSIVECVSIDRPRNKAYFAVQNGLNEVDLETLQVISHEEYSVTITALSDVSYPTPLTVGTGLGIHLHDPRLSHNIPSGVQELDRLDTTAHILVHPNPVQLMNDSFRSRGSDGCGSSGSLSILHQPPSDGINDSNNGEIYVAGRFPSILIYDRRKFTPKLFNTIYSGARLSTLASLAPIPGLSTPRGILAAGEYNGKGSLELYPVQNRSKSSNPSNPSNPLNPSNPSSPFLFQFKNRTSASSSKVLSVVPHGTRLLFSDSNGMLKWVERDGSTLVRRWNINQPQTDASRLSQPRQRGIFADGSAPKLENGGDVARKILGTGLGAKDGIVVWTGEKVGVVEFRKNPRVGKIGDEESEMSLEDTERSLYGEMMTRALERQADEVRFVRGLGLVG